MDADSFSLGFGQPRVPFSCTCRISPPCWRAAPLWVSSRHSTRSSVAPGPVGRSRVKQMPQGSACCTSPAPVETNLNVVTKSGVHLREQEGTASKQVSRYLDCANQGHFPDVTAILITS